MSREESRCGANNRARNMKTACLMCCRCVLPAWVGAATLFVITSISEVRYPGFTSDIRDSLVAIRFPGYYITGFVLLGTGLLTLLCSCCHAALGKRRFVIGLSLVVVSLGLMLVDYITVYQPLLAMITPPGQAKPSTFHGLHEASKWINLAGVLTTLAAAITVNLPQQAPALVQISTEQPLD